MDTKLFRLTGAQARQLHEASTARAEGSVAPYQVIVVEICPYGDGGDVLYIGDSAIVFPPLQHALVIGDSEAFQKDAGNPEAITDQGRTPGFWDSRKGGIVGEIEGEFDPEIEIMWRTVHAETIATAVETLTGKSEVERKPEPVPETELKPTKGGRRK